MNESNIVKQVATADINCPRFFSGCIERDYGLLFHNKDNPDSYDSNHAVITNPDADLRSAVEDIVAFYRSHEQTPRLYHGYLDCEEERLFPVLREMGFEVELNENKMFVFDSSAVTALPRTEHPKIRRLSTVEERVADILREDDGGDWNVSKLELGIQDPRVHVIAQNDGSGATASIAVLYLHDTVSVIEDVTTSPRFRRKGFATSMMAQILELHEGLGRGNPVCLFADNPEAIRVYERLGFGEIEQVHPLWMASLEVT